MSIIFADAWRITINERPEVLESACLCARKDRIDSQLAGYHPCKGRATVVRIPPSKSF
jgi:hypothetical protein